MSELELPSRSEVEDLFYQEAALLDEWRLEDWLELLTDDAIYQIPPTDVPEGDSRNTLFIVADDAVRIRSRVKQLLGRFAWAENPHSRTRRLISNVRILGVHARSVVVAWLKDEADLTMRAQRLVIENSSSFLNLQSLTIPN